MFIKNKKAIHKFKTLLKSYLFDGSIVLSLTALLTYTFINNPEYPELRDSETPKKRTSDQPPLNFKLELICENFISPLGLTHANDGSGRLFIIEQSGRVMVHKNGAVLGTPFLDIRSRLVPINNEYSEMGLLGIAFHPGFKENKKFYVYYSAPTTNPTSHHKSVVAEYKAGENPDVANTEEKIIIEIEQPQGNHNGGQLAFGKDGMLYIALGDGGGFKDAHGPIGNAQDKNSLLGKILRIDVDHKTPYSNPADNPYVAKEGRDEIFAMGFRNPYRFSFDRKTGELFCGDVGESGFEEVNIVSKGKNYGWKSMEGNYIFDSAVHKSLKETYTGPIHAYDHSVGISIAGGFVYRGKKHPQLQGKYIFGDWMKKLFYLEKTSSGKWKRHQIQFSSKANPMQDLTINSFGEDEEGEIYVLGQTIVGASNPSGKIYRISLGK